MKTIDQMTSQEAYDRGLSLGRQEAKSCDDLWTACKAQVEFRLGYAACLDEMRRHWTER